MDLACFNELGLTDIEILKSTGQKTVYTAYSSLHDKVILKVVKPDQGTERVKREIEIIKECNGFNTSTIYDYGVIPCENEEYFYIIESCIDGDNLRDFITQNGKLDYDEVIIFLQTILHALTILEEQKVVHRDIKPENIMRTPNGQYYLIDFGIARDPTKESLTDTSNKFGPHTIGYAPMEQIDNEKTNIDSKTDLYAVGVIAYEMLTGKNPFVEGCENIPQAIRKVDKGTFELLHSKDSKQRALHELIHSCMSRFRSKRPKSAKEAYEWLNDIITQED